MKKSVTCVVKPDYNSDLAFSEKMNDIDFLTDELECSIKQAVNEWKHPAPKTEKVVVKPPFIGYSVAATGYSQGEYQSYQVTINEEVYNNNPNQVKQLNDLLSKCFTHNNNYILELYKEVIVDEEVYRQLLPYECFCFCVTDVEFPEEEHLEERAKEIATFDRIEITEE